MNHTLARMLAVIAHERQNGNKAHPRHVDPVHKNYDITAVRLAPNVEHANRPPRPLPSPSVRTPAREAASDSVVTSSNTAL